MAKKAHLPTVVRLLNREVESPRAHMPERGGWAVTKTAWDMKTVLFVHWAYAGDNMRERGLTKEVRALRDLLKEHGYLVQSREDRNFFFVLPECFEDMADES